MDDQPEVCDECGFDSRRWRVRDARDHLAALGWWWREALSGVDQVDAVRRPAPAVWSPIEYGVHSAFVTAVLRTAIEETVATDGWEAPTFAPPADAADTDPSVDVPMASVIADLEREGQTLATLAAKTPDEKWAHGARLADGVTWRADKILFHAAHDASHHQMDVGHGLVTLGLGTPAHRGRVAQVNTSDGGVPKQPVARVKVGRDGVAGDRQADSLHHGRPFQGVCLWSTEVVDELAAAGHHVFAGCVGENFSLTGVDWPTLRPGARLRIGTALVELSFPAVPCKKQTGWFTDGDFTRIAYENNPQWVRWYGWVREPGEVATGDDVLVQAS
jgi:MOSC domain-containing protein YiiM